MKRLNFRKIIVGCMLLLIITTAFFAGKLYTNYQSKNLYKSHPLLAKRIFLEDANDSVINFAPLRNKLQSELEFERK